MTDETAPPVSASVSLSAGESELLGLLAYAELSAFVRLADDASVAPDLTDEVAVAAMAAAEYSHFDRISEFLRSCEVDPARAMEPFVDNLDAFHAQTSPADWLERLVKVYVGDAMALDFYNEAAAFVSEPVQQLVVATTVDTGHAAFAAERVRSAVTADPTLKGRLALWARRLVGEALTQAQRVAVDHEALASLIVGGSTDLAEVGRMLTRLTDGHSRRMKELGLV